MKIRGLLRLAVAMLGEHRGFEVPMCYGCDLFRVQYLPSNHYLTLFKKSHPLSIIYKTPLKELIFNVPLEKLSVAGSNDKMFQKTIAQFHNDFGNVNATSSAVYRAKARRFIANNVEKFLMNHSPKVKAKLSHKELSQLEDPDSNVRDVFARIAPEDLDHCFEGIVIFRMRQLPSPENRQEFQNHIQKAMFRLKNKSWDKVKMQKAVKLNNTSARGRMNVLIKQTIANKLLINRFGFSELMIEMLRDNVKRFKPLARELGLSSDK